MLPCMQCAQRDGQMRSKHDADRGDIKTRRVSRKRTRGFRSAAAAGPAATRRLFLLSAKRSEGFFGEFHLALREYCIYLRNHTGAFVPVSASITVSQRMRHVLSGRCCCKGAIRGAYYGDLRSEQSQSTSSQGRI